MKKITIKNYKVLLEKHLRKVNKKLCLCTKKFNVKMATLIGFNIFLEESGNLFSNSHAIEIAQNRKKTWKKLKL